MVEPDSTALAAKVLTASDGVIAGTRQDASGDALVARLTEAGYEASRGGRRWYTYTARNAAREGARIAARAAAQAEAGHAPSEPGEAVQAAVSAVWAHTPSVPADLRDAVARELARLIFEKSYK